jgi:type IV pilus assembly protein PilP
MTLWHKTICNCFPIACLILILGLSSPAWAEDTPADTTASQENSGDQDKTIVEIEKSAETFEYQIEGRPDPFLPFISERSTTTNENPDEIVDDNQKLSGMQLFEPGQLTLVALLDTNGKKFAMVQDFTGKGYVIRKGTKIGRRGVVQEIADNRVIITETAETRGGKILTTKIAMVLKKEGEE